MTDDFQQADDATARTATAGDTRAGNRVDDLFSVLAEGRRRRVLEYLDRTDADASVGELLDALVADAGPNTDREDIHLRLYHADLPKLVDAGFVRFNDRTETVSLVEGPDPLRRYLGLDGRAA